MGMVDFHQLSEERSRLFKMWVHGIMQSYENAHYQFRVGLLDEDRWRMHRSSLQFLLGRQGVRLWWATRSDLIESPEFAVLVSEMLGKEPEPASVDP